MKAYIKKIFIITYNILFFIYSLFFVILTFHISRVEHNDQNDIYNELILFIGFIIMVVSGMIYTWIQERMISKIEIFFCFIYLFIFILIIVM